MYWINMHICAQVAKRQRRQVKLWQSPSLLRMWQDAAHDTWARWYCSHCRTRFCAQCKHDAHCRWTFSIPTQKIELHEHMQQPLKWPKPTKINQNQPKTNSANVYSWWWSSNKRNSALDSGWVLGRRKKYRGVLTLLSTHCVNKNGRMEKGIRQMKGN